MSLHDRGLGRSVEPAAPYDDALLERDAEMAALETAVHTARAGGGAVLVIQGPPGVGKTRLLAAAAEHARTAGLHVLSGAGRELEREIALGVAVDMLAPPLAAASPRERAQLLAGLAAPAAPLFQDAAPAGYPAPDTILAGLCHLTANLARPSRASRPMLLTIDDAQWADTASLRFLAMLADRLRRLPVALVVTVRDGDRGSEVPELLRLAAHPPGRLLTPAPLTSEAVGRLVSAVFPEAGRSLTDSVAHASGGNPFLIGELLRFLRADGGTPAPDVVATLVPGTVLRSVLVRLARLPADAGRLAAAVAVLGDGTPLRRAAALAGLELLAAEAAADTLTRARLLRAGNPVTFVHPLIGAAVHADLPVFARSRAHRRAAKLLAADGEGVEKEAGHLLVAEPEGDPDAVRVLREAAGLALRRGDPIAAARLLTRALTEPPPPSSRAELLIELARAQMTAGDLAAKDSLAEGLQLLGDAALQVRVDALTLLAQLRYGLGDPAGAAAAREIALDLLDSRDPGWQDTLAGQLSVATFHPPLRRAAEQRLAPVLADSRSGRPPSQPGLLAHVTLRLAFAGDPPAAVRGMAERALAADPLLGVVGHGTLLGLVVHSLVIAGELAAAEAAAETGLTAAHEQGDVLAYASASYHRGLARFNQGALTTALADLEVARVPLAAGWTSAAGWIGWLLARVQLEYGDHSAAADALLLGDGRPEDSMDSPLLLHAHAELALAQGRALEAFDAACAAGRRLAEIYDVDHPGLLPWRTTAALAAHHAGDRARARRLAAEAVERARATGVAQATGTALRVAGLVARPEPDIDLLTEAADMLERTPAALEHARALIDLGAALRRAGRHDPARGPLREGLAAAHRAHARPLAERARTELHALGLRPRRTAVTGIDALTPAERRVALLALHGQSNRQIAQTLFVTIKTVETHLARAYRKLAISSRGQLHDTFAHIIE